MSVDNSTRQLKDEPKAVQRQVISQRNKDTYNRKKKKDLHAAANNIPMSKMTAFYSEKGRDDCTSSSSLEQLNTNDDDHINVILDEALSDYPTELNARVDDMHRGQAVQAKPVRECCN